MSSVGLTNQSVSDFEFGTGFGLNVVLDGKNGPVSGVGNTSIGPNSLRFYS